jgi:ABC-2 type transport system ATP-binding protein
MHAIIEIKNLKKIFNADNKSVIAVDGIDLVVHAGEIFGFLGPNGAGIVLRRAYFA